MFNARKRSRPIESCDRGYCAIGARKNASMSCKERDELDMKLIQASRAVLAYALEYGPGQDYPRGRLDANERRAREGLAKHEAEHGCRPLLLDRK